MKRVLLIVCVLVFASLTMAQKHVELGEPYRVVDAFTKEYFSRGDTMYSIKITGIRLVFQRYDLKSLNELSREEIDLPRGSEIERIVELNDKVLLFYSVWLRSEHTEQLFCKEINFVSGKIAAGDQLLVTSNVKLSSGSWSYSSFGGAVQNASPKFNICTSFDRSKIFVHYRLVPEFRDDSKNKDVIGFFVFDQSLNKIWGDEKVMPYTEEEMDNLSYTIDGFGRVHMLVRMNDRQSYNYESWIYEGIKKEVKAKIEIKKDNVNDMWAFETAHNEIIYAGTYGNGGSADGLYLLKMNANGTFNEGVYHEIPSSVLKSYKTERRQNKIDKKEQKGQNIIFPNFVLRNVEVMNNGDIVMSGEQFYIEQRTYTDADGRTRTTIVYHYNDMLICKILKNGDLAWIEKLPKYQVGGAYQGSKSFKYIPNIQENEHYMVYVDVLDNIDLPTNEYAKTYVEGREGFLTVYKIDDLTGKFTKQNLFSIKKVHDRKLYQFSMNRIVQSGSKELVMEFYKKKKEDILIRTTIK